MQKLTKEEYQEGVKTCEKRFTHFEPRDKEYVVLHFNDKDVYISLTDIEQEGIDNESWDSYTTYYKESYSDLGDFLKWIIDGNVGG